MKKIVSLAFGILFSIGAFAQKIGYVDTDYILDKIPEYKDAQKNLDNLSVEWQKQIEMRYAEIDKLYKSYQAEEILLTEERKRQRQDEIIQKERDAKDFQKMKFGVDGELFQKRQELIKPIQDKVYSAVKELAKIGAYAIIFDKADGATMLYANPKYNVSNEILKKLGIEVEEQQEY